MASAAGFPERVGTGACNLVDSPEVNPTSLSTTSLPRARGVARGARSSSVISPASSCHFNAPRGCGTARAAAVIGRAWGLSAGACAQRA
eukprot:8206021-Pyramimonas_sp.AAC.1